MRTREPAKRIAAYGVLTALALVLSYVEAMIPVNIGIPGAKLGLPNLVTMLLLYTAGPKAAIVIAVVRIVVTGFTFGNLFMIFYSASGFVLSILVMLLLKRSQAFSVTGVSLAGGVAHNLGQLCCAAFLTGPYVFAYFPVLLCAGILAGLGIGLLGGLLVKRVGPLLRQLL